MKRCPKCRTQHFDGVDLCDCGYRFSSETIEKIQSANIQQSRTGIKRLLTGAAVLVLALIAGNYVGKTSGTKAASAMNRIDSANVQATPQLSTGTEIQTFVTRQNAEGYTNDQLDSQSLPRFENIITEMIVEKSRANLKARGIDPNEITARMYSADSRLVEFKGEKFVVIDTLGPADIKVKTILTIRNGELTRVTCLRQGEEIPFTWGACAKQIESTFNIKFPKVD